LYLVLCHPYDAAAIWAHEALTAAVDARAELVLSSELALAARWQHRVTADGSLDLCVELQDGRELRSSEVRGVLNRLMSAPLEVVAAGDPDDAEYATAEMVAFYMSWLNAFAVTINRPTPQGLCGAWRHGSEWAVLAARAGLDAPDYRQSDDDPPEHGFGSLAPPGAASTSVLVLRGELFGPALPDDVAEACVRLAELSGTDLLGIELCAAAGGTPALAYATPWPDLRHGGAPLIAALAQALEQGVPA
jgi:hypothetical protein